MKNLIVGPSHVVRMQHAKSSNCLPADIDEPVFIGMGGAPTWSDNIFNKVSESLDSGSKIHLILGDYRFGNNILAEGKDVLSQDKVYINIHGEFLTPENDRKMYGFYLQGLDKWRSSYPNINIIPWTLLMRRAENISTQHHVDVNGIYTHPTVNEEMLIGKYCEPSYLRCLEIPSSVLKNFYIDNDLHPSTLGYVFLTKCITKLDPHESVYASLKIVEFVISDFFKKLSIEKKIYITGDSVAMATIKKVLPFEYNLKNFLCFEKDHGVDYIEINIESVTSSLSNSNFSNAKDNNKISFPWDYLGFSAISQRHPDLKRLQPAPHTLPLSEPLSYYELFKSDEFFDIGEKLTPTLKGMLFILSLASRKPSNEKVAIINNSIKDMFSSVDHASFKYHESEQSIKKSNETIMGKISNFLVSLLK